MVDGRVVVVVGRVVVVDDGRRVVLVVVLDEGPGVVVGVVVKGGSDEFRSDMVNSSYALVVGSACVGGRHLEARTLGVRHGLR